MSHADSGPLLGSRRQDSQWQHCHNSPACESDREMQESFIHITAIESFTWKHFIFVSLLDLRVLAGCYEGCSVKGTRNLSLLIISGVINTYIFFKKYDLQFFISHQTWWSFIMDIDILLQKPSQYRYQIKFISTLKNILIQMVDFNKIHILVTSCIWGKWHSTM